MALAPYRVTGSLKHSSMNTKGSFYICVICVNMYGVFLRFLKN